MPSPEIIARLIERFKEHRETYMDPSYKEARLRSEFLDPFFEALGWDVGNTKDYSEAFKDVVVEDALRVEGAARAPDYAFRIGGQTQFYAEAKKPAINLKNDPEPAFQLRRYAWTKKLPVGVLSDFDELAIYDTRIKPKAGDQARTARVVYYTSDQYLDEWDSIEGLLSKEAIQRGAIEKFIGGRRPRGGGAEVDDEFLEDIEAWRRLLARDIHRRNAKLSIDDLTFAVQRTIDRIIFLRICEDRGIEPRERLLEASRSDQVYKRLIDVYLDADNRYNSGLFHFRPEKGRQETPDDITLNIDIGTNGLRAILRGLYPPESPYAFSVLPADILGQVYERFLGKTIAARGHSISIVEKPERRKSEGVYYTPTYVVNHIVRKAVGPHFQGKQLSQVQSVRVLDPACGSGSFLIQAYQYILDWYLERYTEEDPEALARKRKPVVRATPGHGWRLTTHERKRILLRHIYGVDLDPQAVEVSKLSLLLKVLEGETEETLTAQLRLLHERALPDLGRNIKAGNSLIGEDIYGNLMFELLPEDEREAVRPFDWRSAFPRAAKDGGFDAIIGNPPYIPIEAMEDYERSYYADRHPQLDRKFDTSVVFTLAMLRRLKPKGLLGFISSVTWQTGENFAQMREHIFGKHGVREIVNLPFDVFKDAYVDTGIFVLSRRVSPEYQIFSFPKKTARPELRSLTYSTVDKVLVKGPEFRIILNPEAHAIFDRASGSRKFTTLGDLTISTQGLAANRFTIRSTPKPGWYPFLYKGQAYRYRLEVEEIAYADMAEFPSLKQFYEAQPKLLIRRVVNRADRLMIATTDQQMVFKKDINPFVLVEPSWDLHFLLAILNSAVISFIYVNASTIATKDDFRQTTLAELRRLPLPRYDAHNSDHARLAQLGRRLAAGHSKLAASDRERAREAIEKEIGAAERQVDEIVNRLYGVRAYEVAAMQAASPGQPEAEATS